MPNAHRGEAEIPGVGVLRFDWDGVAALIGEFGEGFDATITKAAQGFDLDTLARAAAIGLGMTVEDFKRASPPIVPTVNAVMAALNLAFHGQEAPAAPVENPPNRKTRRAISSPKRAGKRSA